jgi:hypothetical protein
MSLARVFECPVGANEPLSITLEIDADQGPCSSVISATFHHSSTGNQYRGIITSCHNALSFPPTLTRRDGRKVVERRMLFLPEEIFP